MVKPERSLLLFLAFFGHLHSFDSYHIEYQQYLSSYWLDTSNFLLFRKTAQMDDLLARLAAGDRVAFNHIYKQHFLKLYYFTRRFIANEAHAEDIVAETFIKLWERRANFSNPQSLVSFLYITARNSSLDAIRSSKRDLQRINAYLDQLELSELPVEPVQADEIKAEVLQNIREQIEKLPPKCRHIFKLAYLEGKTNEQIMEQTNLRYQTVKNQKRLGLKLIRLRVTKRSLISILLMVSFIF